jgi:chromosomal replication initiator protein
LNHTYTFDSFVVGSNNKFAYQVALTVAEEPGSYNPFFLYSGVGLGKTHLIQAIGNHILKNFKDKKVIYVTSEQFMNDLLSAIRERTQHNFKRKYRDVDVLLIDDIQFIAGKEATQEEFFNTFNALYMNNKQIVITSDRPPKDIHHLEERMRSRFASGMITDMQTPDTETRMAILLEKQTMFGHELDHDVLNIIAESITSNIRELEGAFKQIMMYEKSMGGRVTVEMAKSQLLINSSSVADRIINPNDIIKHVCDFFSVNSKDIKGPKRQRHFVIPRQISMYLMKELTNLPYMGIGDLLGGRDHTTIMHGVQCIESQLSTDPKFKQQITLIREKLLS